MGRSPFDASIAGPTCAARADCDFQPEEKDLVEPRGLDGGLGCSWIGRNALTFAEPGLRSPLWLRARLRCIDSEAGALL
eukprot:COSAG01_NODE_23305_length_820_cov_1.090153_2_plen_79_part_00